MEQIVTLILAMYRVNSQCRMWCKPKCLISCVFLILALHCTSYVVFSQSLHAVLQREHIRTVLPSGHIISDWKHLSSLRQRNVFSLCVRYPLHTLSLTFSKNLFVRITPMKFKPFRELQFSIWHGQSSFWTAWVRPWYWFFLFVRLEGSVGPRD